MKNRIYSIKNNALNENDRLQLATFLIKAGYSVRIGREKKANSSANVYFVEYWEEE